MMPLSPEVLSAGALTLLSVLATYVPGVNTWHAGLSSQRKQLLWLGLLLGVTAGTIVWQCTPEAGCSWNDWRSWVETYVHALLLGIGGNQGIHLLLPEPQAVKTANMVGKLRRGTG